jgi:hypothetical protein
LQLLAQALDRNHHLKEFSLRWHGCLNDDSCVQAFAAALAVHVSLESFFLNLEHNVYRFGAPSNDPLVNALRENHHFQKFERYSFLSNNDLVEYAAALAQNSSLEFFALGVTTL